MDIRQHGQYEDFLKLADEAMSTITVPKSGASYCVALETSELDEHIKIVTDNDKAATGLKVENKKAFFTITDNTTGIPRRFYVRLSYVDGWNITRQTTITLSQSYL